MENILKFGSAALLVAGLSLSASAFERGPDGHLKIEYARDGQPKYDTNCEVLKAGYPLLCVHNLTDFDITRITCENWTTADMPIPRGVIPSGHTAIMELGKGKCSKHLKVYINQKGTMVPIAFEKFDVNSNSDLAVLYGND